jgi:hypothetical protein
MILQSMHEIYENYFESEKIRKTFFYANDSK